MNPFISPSCFLLFFSLLFLNSTPTQACWQAHSHLSISCFASLSPSFPSLHPRERKEEVRIRGQIESSSSHASSSCFSSSAIFSIQSTRRTISSLPYLVSSNRFQQQVREQARQQGRQQQGRGEMNKVYSSMIDHNYDFDLTAMPIFERGSYDDQIAVILVNCNETKCDDEDQNENEIERRRKKFEDYIWRYRQTTGINLVYAADLLQENKDARVGDGNGSEQRVRSSEGQENKGNNDNNNNSYNDKGKDQQQDLQKQKSSFPILNLHPFFMDKDTSNTINVLRNNLFNNIGTLTNNLVAEKEISNPFSLFPTFSMISPLLISPLDLLTTSKFRKSQRQRRKTINLSRYASQNTNSKTEKDIATTTTSIPKIKAESNGNDSNDNSNSSNSNRNTNRNRNTLLEMYGHCIEQGATHILIHPCRTPAVTPSTSVIKPPLLYDIEDLVEEASSIFPGAQWKITESLNPWEEVDEELKQTAVDLDLDRFE